MSSDQNAETTETALEINEPTELSLLQARATAMGITFHPALGINKLKARIDEHLNPTVPKDTLEVTPQAAAPIEKSAGQLKRERFDRLRKEAGKLIRVRISCMNPNKKEHEGEIFSAGNDVIGDFKKYVPFNAEDGWHVPQIILNMIRERKCQVFYTIKGPRGNKIRKGKLIPEFAIEILEPLTPTEIKDLAQRQAMANNQA